MDVADFAADRLHEPRDVLVLVSHVLLEVERTRGTEQRAYHAMRLFVDPQRAGYQIEVEAARHDPQLPQHDRVAVGEHENARIAAGEAVVSFAPRRERVAEADALPLSVVRSAEPHRDAVICGVERIVGDVALQVFRELGAGAYRGDHLASADHVDASDRVSAPVDPQGQLAAIQHAVAA